MRLKAGKRRANVGAFCSITLALGRCTYIARSRAFSFLFSLLLEPPSTTLKAMVALSLLALLASTCSLAAAAPALDLVARDSSACTTGNAVHIIVARASTELPGEGASPSFPDPASSTMR